MVLPNQALWRFTSSLAQQQMKRGKSQPQRPLEAMQKKKPADIRHVFLKSSHSSRIRLSAVSLANPFQAPILWQEIDYDLMPMSDCKGSSEKARRGIFATNSSALSYRDLLPCQQKARVNSLLLQFEPDQMQIDEHVSHGEGLFVDKDSFCSVVQTWWRQRLSKDLVFWS